MTDDEEKPKAKSATVHSVVVAAQVLEFLAESGRAQRVTNIAAHLENDQGPHIEAPQHLVRA